MFKKNHNIGVFVTISFLTCLVNLKQTQAAGWITNPYNGHQYQAINCGNWQACEASAQAQAAHIVTINDSTEQAWLLSTFGNSTWYWIGFTDNQREGNFVSTTGEPVTYTNWSRSEPNNMWSGGEHYAVMNWFSSSGAWNDLGSTSPQWNLVASAIIESSQTISTPTPIIDTSGTVATAQEQQLLMPLIAKIQNAVTQSEIETAKAQIKAILSPTVARKKAPDGGGELGTITAFARTSCPDSTDTSGDWREAKDPLYLAIITYPFKIIKENLILWLETGTGAGIRTINVSNDPYTPSGWYLTMPDLRGEFIRGWDHGRGVDPKRQIVTIGNGNNIAQYDWQGQQQANAVGTVEWGNNFYTGGRSDGVYKINNNLLHGGISTIEFTPKAGTEIRPRNLAFLYCIKVR